MTTILSYQSAVESRAQYEKDLRALRKRIIQAYWMKSFLVQFGVLLDEDQIDLPVGDLTTVHFGSHGVTFQSAGQPSTREFRFTWMYLDEDQEVAYEDPTASDLAELLKTLS